MKFGDYKLDTSTCEALHTLSYQSPLPVQEAIILLMLEEKSTLVKSRTESGKTTSFVVPIIRDLIWEERLPQTLTLSSTRELALQIRGEFDNTSVYKCIKTTAVFGKQFSCFQAQDIKQRTHVIAGTPRRVLDYLGRGTFRIEKTHYIIIDKADGMLNMGSIETARGTSFHLPRNAPVYIFSAILPQGIQELTHDFLKQAEVVETESRTPVSEQVHHYAYRLKEHEKPQILLELLYRELPEPCTIFAKIQGYVREIYRALYDKGISIDQLHGGMLQGDRLEDMRDFRLGKLRILTATDVAARGIGIQNVTHTISYDMPDKKRAHIHRIDRSVGLDRSGTTTSFVSQYDDFHLQELEEYLGNALELHDGSKLEAAIADAETLGELGIPKSRKEEEGKEPRKDMMKLCLDGGRAKEIRPGNIVGVICEMEGVCGDDIGVIQVQDHQSYVDIPHGRGLQVLHALRQETIRGKEPKVERVEEQSYSCHRL